MWDRFHQRFVKFMFSKKATKIDDIFTVYLTLCSKCQIDGEDLSIFVSFLENTNFKKPCNDLTYKNKRHFSLKYFWYKLGSKSYQTKYVIKYWLFKSFYNKGYKNHGTNQNCYKLCASYGMLLVKTFCIAIRIPDEV